MVTAVEYLAKPGQSIGTPLADVLRLGLPQERQVHEILEEWNLPWSNLDSMV
jgi:hypothetical protein